MKTSKKKNGTTILVELARVVAEASHKAASAAITEYVKRATSSPVDFDALIEAERERSKKLKAKRPPPG